MLCFNEGAFRPRGIGTGESESQGPERVVGLWQQETGVPVGPGCFVSTKGPSVQEG